MKVKISTQKTYSIEIKGKTHAGFTEESQWHGLTRFVKGSPDLIPTDFAIDPEKEKVAGKVMEAAGITEGNGAHDSLHATTNSPLKPGETVVRR